MKAYTDINQSKRLEEILPIESADMCYPLPYEDGDKPLLVQGGFGSTPCWSLAALLEQIPSDLDSSILTIEKNDSESLKYELNYHDRWEGEDYIQTKYYDNLVDACVEMILKLHEQKLL